MGGERKRLSSHTGRKNKSAPERVTVQALLSRKGTWCPLLVLAIAPIWGSLLVRDECHGKVTLEIKQSSIPSAGLGVFIPINGTDITKGTVLTRYGGKDVSMSDTQGTPEESYSMKIPSRPGWVRAGSPWTQHVPASVCKEPIGHLLNDGGAIWVEPGVALTARDMESLVERYRRDTGQRENTRFAEHAMEGSWEMIASRDIPPGNELFLSYGAYYWLSGLYHDSPDPSIRLVAYLQMVKDFPETFPGDRLEVGPDLKPRLSSSRAEAGEGVCQYFCTEVLGMGLLGQNTAFRGGFVEGEQMDGYKGLLASMLAKVFTEKQEGGKQ